MTKLGAQLSPTELEKQRNRRRVFYPVARIDIQAIFEDYQADSDRTPRTFKAVPKSMTIIRNSYNQADTWQVTFDLKDFPISPETVRAGALELRLFHKDGLYEAAETTTVLSDSTLGIEPTIVGLFDDLSVELSDQGKTVSISGTDYTALFIGSKWPKEKRIRAGQRLDQTIKDLVEEAGGSEALRVIVEPVGDEANLPIVGSSDGRTNRKSIKVQAETYWDAIYKTALRYGYIAFVRNLDVVLTNPKSYIEGQTEVKKLAWGENLTALRMSRKLGKQRTPTIEVKSYDDDKREVIVARYPKRSSFKKLTVNKDNTKADAKEEIKSFTLPGIKDKTTLEKAAEAYFNLVSRSEQTAQVETMDLVDLEGNDLMDLRTGDAVKISFNPVSVDMLEVQKPGERIETLVKLGYDRETAAQVSEAVEKSTFFRRPLRVKTVSFQWDVSSGLSITTELQNFVQIDLDERKA